MLQFPFIWVSRINKFSLEQYQSRYHDRNIFNMRM